MFFLLGFVVVGVGVVAFRKKCYSRKIRNFLTYIKLQFLFFFFFFFEQSSLILGSGIKIFTLYVMAP